MRQPPLVLHRFLTLGDIAAREEMTRQAIRRHLRKATLIPFGYTDAGVVLFTLAEAERFHQWRQSRRRE